MSMQDTMKTRKQVKPMVERIIEQFVSKKETAEINILNKIMKLIDDKTESIVIKKSEDIYELNAKSIKKITEYFESSLSKIKPKDLQNVRVENQLVLPEVQRVAVENQYKPPEIQKVKVENQMVFPEVQQVVDPQSVSILTLLQEKIDDLIELITAKEYPTPPEVQAVEVKNWEHAVTSGQGFKQSVSIIDKLPTEGNNPSLVLGYTDGNLTTITKTINGVEYQKTLSYTGANLTGVSAWSEV